MKRLLALFLSLVLMLGAVVPAYATGDGNFDGGGGGMGSGTSTNYWNPGMDGVRISVVNVDSHAVVGNTVDWSNQNPSTNMIHFGKVSKLSYNSGRALSPVVGGYTCVRPAQSLPRIISSGDYPASIAAIRSYFTDEQVIRAIAGYVGIDFDTLIAGDYKIVVEPIAYFVYGGAYYAMTATEAALYDQKVNGDLRSKMGSLTHKNLPLAIFLEEADLGYPAWSGSTNSKVSNDQIISSLGIGVVRFNGELEPPNVNEFDYEYRVDTDVISSVEVSGGQSDPDNPVTVRFVIQGRTYTVSNVYYPDGDSQLVWVKWHTPSEPCVITIAVSVSGGGTAQSMITCNIVDLDGNDPPNPVADDRNDAFRQSTIYHPQIPLRCITVQVDQEFIDQYLQEISGDLEVNFSDFFKEKGKFYLPNVNHAMQSLYEYLLSMKASRITVEAKIYEIISYLASYLKENRLNEENGQPINKTDLQALAELTHYMDEHYSFNITLQTLSTIACMSESKMKKLFKSVYNMSITEYIQRKRISVAEHMLIQTDLTIAEISRIVGYSNPSRLIEIFKRYYGFTPSKYRK